MVVRKISRKILAKKIRQIGLLNKTQAKQLNKP